MTSFDATQELIDALAFRALPAQTLQTAIDPIVIEAERPGDEDAREALLDRAFGPARFRKTCEVLRAGRLPARGLSLVARCGGEVVGTVRLWHVSAGGVPALMLGPLAVDSRWRAHGIGARLMVEALDRAKALGHDAVLLVGDAPYYARFGFKREPVRGLRLPGPVETERFLGLELRPGAFAAAKGLVRGTGPASIAVGRAHRPKLRRAA
ncbi:MAG: N-acetyltransferase [Beijerinckiaceae bacterium]|nr:N-acetyltransferase [Beijerinckiaceae bacterium]